MVKANSTTIFIACHLADSGHGLEILVKLFDGYDNLYAYIAAFFREVATLTKRTKAFFEKYQDWLVYGTDMGMDAEMYENTLRTVKTDDEHFTRANISLIIGRCTSWTLVTEPNKSYLMPTAIKC